MTFFGTAWYSLLAASSHTVDYQRIMFEPIYEYMSMRMIIMDCSATHVAPNNGALGITDTKKSYDASL